MPSKERRRKQAALALNSEAKKCKTLDVFFVNNQKDLTKEQLADDSLNIDTLPNEHQVLPTPIEKDVSVDDGHLHADVNTGSNNVEEQSGMQRAAIDCLQEIPVVNIIDPARFDVGNIIQNHVDVALLENVERCKYIQEHFVPPLNYLDLSYQSINIHDRQHEKKLYFRRAWLDEYQWLVYSPVLGGGLCKYCVMFPPNDNCKIITGALVSKAFIQYRKAKGKNYGILDVHDSAAFHKRAMSAANDAIDSLNNPRHQIDYIINKQRQETFEKNVHVLKCIVQAVIFCGKQNVALRGHRDDSTSTVSNKGNFLAILDLLAAHDSILNEHLQLAKKNATYTSKTIQNEIICLIGQHVRNTLTANLKEHLPSQFFSIIADEVTDVCSNQEVLSLCLRLLNRESGSGNIEIVEWFFDFRFLKRTTGEAISTSILDILASNGLDIGNLRGQAYDGASAMSSETIGVNGKIKQVSPRAIYVHCNSHVLNLVIAAACKLPAVRNMIDSINETYLFFHNSPKRQKFFQQVLLALECNTQKTKLLGLCKTRWVERHNCYDTFLEMFVEIQKCLEAIITPHLHPDLYNGENWLWDSDTKVKAQGLLSTMRSFQFIITFVTVRNCLQPIKPMASLLQLSDLDCYEASCLIDFCMNELQRVRREIETNFNTWYDDAVELCSKVGGIVTMPRITGRQLYRNNTPSSSPMDYYRNSLTIQFLDHLNTEMDIRFSAESRKAYDLFELIPKLIVKITDTKQLVEKLQYWKDDLPSVLGLEAEIQHWQEIWHSRIVDKPTTDLKFADRVKNWCKERKSPSNNMPESLLDTYNSCNNGIFPNIKVLLAIGCVLPVGSASAERSFSGFRRIKTYLRSTMTEERLSGLSLMHLHHSMDIDIAQVVSMFITKNRRRLFDSSILCS